MLQAEVGEADEAYGDHHKLQGIAHWQVLDLEDYLARGEKKKQERAQYMEGRKRGGTLEAVAKCSMASLFLNNSAVEDLKFSCMNETICRSVFYMLDRKLLRILVDTIIEPRY